jgi:hypothetical protein
MPKITVNKLTTANTTPTITGKATFQRFDIDGKTPKEAIEIILNYSPYYLFEGNLGLEETATKDEYIWKLHIDSPLYPGTYDVEANIYRVSDDLIIASDDTVNEITISYPPTTYVNGAPPKSLAQKAATVAALMNALQNLFGNGGVGGPSPAVHPTQDDQSSSSLASRGNEERSEDPRVKSKKQVVDKAPLPPKKHNFDSTDNSSGAQNGVDWELATLDNARSETGLTAQEQNAADAEAARLQGASEAEVANIQQRAAPDEAAGLIANNPGGTGNAATDVGSPFG